MPILLLFVEKLADLIFSLGQDKVIDILRRRKVKAQIRDIVTQSYNETIQSFPISEEIISNFNPDLFLNNSIVENELSKLFSRSEKPNISTLSTEFRKCFIGKAPNYSEQIMDTFINILEKKLCDIPDFANLFSQKQTSQILQIVTTNQIQSSLLLEDSTQGLVNKDNKEEVKLASKLDICANLYRRGDALSCLSQINEIERNISPADVNPNVYARLLTIKGGCLLDLENITEAQDCMIRANDLCPNNADHLTNLALIYFLKDELNESEKCAIESLKLKPQDNEAKSVQIQINIRKGDFSVIENTIDPSYLTKPSYLLALSQFYEKIGDVKNSENFFRKCLAIEPNNIFALSAFVAFLFNKAIHFDIDDPYRDLSKNENNDIYEALQLVNKTIEIQKDRNNPILMNNLIASRAAINGFLGNTEQAIFDCDTVLRSNPNQELALRNRALLAFAAKDYELTIQLLEGLEEGYLIANRMVMPYLLALSETDNHSLCLHKIKSFLSSVSVEEKNQIELLELDILAKDKNFDQIQAKIAMLTSIQEKSANDNFLLGSSFAHLRDIDNALISFKNALSKSKTTYEKIKILEPLLHILYDQNEYADLVEVAQPFVDIILHTPHLSRLYVFSLYMCREYGTALSIIDRLISNGNYSDLLDLQMKLNEYFDNYPEAIQIQRKLLDESPKDLDNKLNLIRLLFINDEKEEAIKLIQEIDSNTLNPDELIKIAEILSLTKNFTKSLEYAYLAIRNGNYDSQITSSYIRIFLRCSRNEDPIIENVVNNSAILVDDNNSRTWIKIITICQPNSAFWEYSPESIYGLAFLGHKIGDEIIVNSESLAPKKFKIIDFCSIYKKAFNDSINDFNTRFPDNFDFQKIPIVNDDPTNIFQMVARFGKQVVIVESFYLQNSITLEQFAFHIGTNLALFIMEMQRTPTLNIFSSSGTRESIALEHEIIQTSDEIVLSLSALITCSKLGILNFLNKRFKKIYITKKTLQEVENALIIQDFKLNQDGYSTLIFQNGRFYNIEITAEEIDKSIKSLEELKNFIKNHCIFQSIPSTFLGQFDNLVKKTEIIGKLSTADVILAKYKILPIFTDDLVFRIISQNVFGVESFWSQTFVKNLTEKNFIDENEYCNLCGELAALGYSFISVSELEIFNLLKRESFFPSEFSMGLIYATCGLQSEENIAITICVKLIKLVWLNCPIYDNKVKILDKVLQVLCERRNIELVIGKFLNISEKVFVVSPYHLEQIKREIKLILKSKLLVQKRNIIS